jgi:hypothetical protein
MMNRSEWNNFIKAKEHFRSITEEYSLSLPNLKKIQQEFADSRPEGKNASYKVETPVVYNSALDDITQDSEIKLILVADNPGRREQAAENWRYLVGPSGKIADKFFRDNPELGIDFRKDVIILNKTPIHSPRTVELNKLCLLGKEKLCPALPSALEESQRDMAALLLEFQEALGVPVWITGYSEMKKNGIFESYTETLKKLYAQRPELYKQLYIFRHFSMNQFTIDLRQQAQPKESVEKALRRIGSEYRKRIL